MIFQSFWAGLFIFHHRELVKGLKNNFTPTIDQITDDILDITGMVNCILNGCFDGSQCDVNEDGSLDVFDIILTINCILDDCPLNAIEIYPGENIQEIVDNNPPGTKGQSLIDKRKTKPSGEPDPMTKAELKSYEKKQTEELDLVTIRFAGDSGDGMQLTGNQFTENSAIFGNDISTFPDFPAEIRAPAGSLAGVSSFQLQFSNKIFLKLQL